MLKDWKKEKLCIKIGVLLIKIVRPEEQSLTLSGSWIGVVLWKTEAL
jgi:hypothetical protein